MTWEEYAPRLMDQAAFNIACLATVHDTNFEYFAQDDFRVRKPDIKIQVRTGGAVAGHNSPGENLLFVEKTSRKCRFQHH